MTWGVATALLEQRGEEGLFEVDEAWLPRVAAELDPRLIVLGNLFRDQLDRYGELEHLADEWARGGRRRGRARPASSLNADDPLIADLGRDRELAPARRRHLLRDRGPEPGAAGAPARLRRQALPPLRRSLRLRARLRRPPRPLLAAPTAAPIGPAPDVAATRIELEGMGGSRVAVRTPDGEVELRLPLPGLYNVYNALAALAAALRLGHRAASRRPGALEAMQAAFGRVETIEVGGKAGLDPADQEPGRRQRGAAHAAAGGERERRRPRPRPLDRAQRPDRRRPRRLLGLGRRLRAARRPRPPGGLRRHPGAGDGGAAEVRRHGRRRDRGRARRSTPRSTARSREPTGASSPCPPTPPCSSCATCSPSAAWPGSTGDERRRRLWHDVECGGYAADLAAWERAGRRRPKAPCSSSAAGPAGWPCTWRGAGTSVWAVDDDADLVAAPSRRATRRGAARATRVSARTSGSRRLDRELRACDRADAAHPDARRRRRSGRRPSAEWPRTCEPAGDLAAAIVEGCPRPSRRGRRRFPTSASSTAGSTRACRSTSRPSNGGLELRRLRQAVSPDGALSEDEHIDSPRRSGRRRARGRGASDAGLRAGRPASRSRPPTATSAPPSSSRREA